MDLLSVKQKFGIIGNNPEMNRALEVAIRVANTDLSVLITGESGVGKEFFPQVIHAHSSRKHNKYITINCGAIPDGTIDSELFGHEKNSFTGAGDSRKGYFEEADGGTIFLDEVGELPQSTQVRLLRVLQTGDFMKVGSSISKKVNVRVIAATNSYLEEAIKMGRFRADLFYRLNTVPIQVPSLRNRKEDIYLLFRKFTYDIATKYRMPSISLDLDARDMLENYYWAGNIRQLKSVAEQISAIEESRLITPNILAKYLPNSFTSTVPMVLDNRTQPSKSMDEERDLLFKVLFDLKSDISELKKMVAELKPNNVEYDQYKIPNSEIAGLLPSNFPPTTITKREDLDSNLLFTRSEEVIEKIGTSLGQTKEQMQKEMIIKALKKNNGKRREAAKDLFISERTLYRKIKELEINEI